MNPILSFCLASAALTLPFTMTHAATIVSGEADYVGDFSASVTVGTSNSLSNAQLDGGWFSGVNTNAFWEKANDQLERSGQNAFIARGAGIAINEDGVNQSQGTLSFDYELTGENANDDESIYYFYGVNDASNFSLSLNADGQSAPSSTNLTLISSFGFGNQNDQTVSGTHTSSLLNLAPATYEGYVFAIYSPSSAGPSNIDNVTLTVVPEPSTAALLLAGLAGILIYPRRKDR